MKKQDRERLLRREVISGSEILLRTLLLEGVECVFGYPGGSVLYIYDAMHGNPDFNHLLTRHEQGAIHAADGYARATGKTGVCLATSGPGATNLITGIATAYADSVPLVVITGNVATSLLGTDAFQEADILGMTQPVTKHSYMARRPGDLPRILREAFYLASSGRKGPVLVDIPKDVSAATAEFIYPEEVSVRGYTPAPEVSPSAVRELGAAIRRAKRPLLIAGAGVIHSGAEAELARLARGAGIPVTTTLLGIGAFPTRDPLALGMAGMHGTVAANRAILGCDLLISVGSRFDDRLTMRPDRFARQAVIAHIDIDAAEIDKLVPSSLPVVGDARAVLTALLHELELTGGEEEGEAGARHDKPTGDWLNELEQIRSIYPLRYHNPEDGLKPQYVIEQMAELTGGEAIVTTDVGQHQMWTAQFGWFNQPRTLITSGGLGTMGFGFPSAIGAQIGNPGRTVISVNGDGGMQMCSQELAVCALHGIPVKIAVINNRTLGMIKQWQELVYDGRHSHIDLSGSPDFVKLAQAYGVRGLRAETKQEARKAWMEALEHPGPVLIDFVVDRDELVYPMVPQGKALEDMIIGTSS
ncbi:MULTISPECIES: biosynthetic-type acetolactate synthase large subunit [Paenibacillus]|uniref:biosynthetic-type acetolactate synthase large subunit n=1 Tax=Paenibacillus TaxID=44249 RepID=UPI000A4FA742|nr:MULTISPECIES: biosynthetic-type acetolactate synthase large subunit [Paenibacillus]MDU4698465.1 biosynthetic-type acetolactate synthase large subunit [Paenibacillus sp.]